MEIIPVAGVKVRVWSLAGPLIISNISVALLGIVDTAVVGHLEHAYYLGAVAIGSVIFDFLYWGMGFLRMGTTGVVAQLHGKADSGGSRAALIHACVIALLVAVTIVLFQAPIIKTGLYLAGGSNDVTSFAQAYLQWGIWGAPAVLISMVLMGWLLGMHNAKATLITAVSVNLLNIVLDLFFVFVLQMDVRGVALASVLSQYFGLCVAMFFVSRELKKYPGTWSLAELTDKYRVKKFLHLNGDIFIRTVCLIFAFSFFTRQGARQGDQILAANAILLNFQAVLALALDGFANAAEALVGKAVGSGNRKMLYESVLDCTRLSMITALGFSMTFALAGVFMIQLMTGLQEVRDICMDYLPWLIASPVISVWCFLLDGIFIGATRTREMRNMMLISSFLIFLPAWYFLQPLGNHGLWLSFMLFFAARGITLLIAAVRIDRQEGLISGSPE